MIGLDRGLEQLRANRQTHDQDRVTLNLRLIKVEAEGIHARHGEAEILSQAAGVEEIRETGDDGDPNEADCKVDERVNEFHGCSFPFASLC